VQLRRFAGDLGPAMALSCGCSVAYHVMLPSGNNGGGVLQNRRCAELYNLSAPAATGRLPGIGKGQRFTSLRSVLEEVVLAKSAPSSNLPSQLEQLENSGSYSSSSNLCKLQQARALPSLIAPLMMSLSERQEDVHLFTEDDQVRRIELSGRSLEAEPHRFVYLLYAPSLAYAETLETIMLSRQQTMG